MPLQLYVSRQFCGSTKLVRKLKFKCLQFSAAVKIAKKKKKRGRYFMGFLESKEIKLKWVSNSSPLTHQAHIIDTLKYRVQEEIN